MRGFYEAKFKTTVLRERKKDRFTDRQSNRQTDEQSEKGTQMYG